ncbi:PTS sugar transporter subunit IIA [Oenococcus sicerae]|uniref:PTS sugar transporter subunit IIA n=1 Tax=Oenococcus sicerae TaxID=2203724 RepID=A0ABX5QNG3_9LACO|nr:PTS sugar transporter subunit IIA [Oenococcus sicerae]QAS70341.1 PTS sugar transporter subunit IIA [Oenococcus sicerae]
MTLIDANLVFTDVDVEDKVALIDFLADKLYENGNVKITFQEAVEKREQKYPTGLPTGAIQVAIPHTDAKYVNKSVIAFANLKHPIEFQNMAINGETLKVSVVVMLAIAEPHGQVKTLEKLMSIFQDEKLLVSLSSEKDSKKIYQKLVKLL